MRLPEDTPVRKAMVEYDRPLKMARSAPKFTWNKKIENHVSILIWKLAVHYKEHTIPKKKTSYGPPWFQRSQAAETLE